MERNDNYTVSIYSTPLSLPLFFAVHTHVVCTYKTESNRFDVTGHVSSSHPTAIDRYIFKNLLPTEAGFRILPSLPTHGIGPRWTVTLHSSVTGPAKSPAHQLYTYIVSGGLQNYPYRDRYHMFLGPNSNTFTQWVVDQVPECKLKLPWNAWGKGYIQR